MTRKIIIITGSALIGLITMLSIIFVMIATGAIEVEQKTLVISSASAEAVYSGEALTAGGWEITSGELREGHTAKVIVSGQQTSVGSSVNTLSATIVDENGADVTEYYKIEYQPGTLKVFHRSIQVLANTASKTYDGTPLTCQQYTIASGELPAGHSIVPTFAGSITDVGTVANNVSVIIRDAMGVDVSGNYDITTLSGTLTVSKRAIYLQSESATKTYDGTPLTAESYSIISGELVSGQKITASYAGSITNVGTVLNELSVTIKDVKGRNVTDNYDVNISNGSLTVTKRNVEFQSENYQKIYDGVVYKTNEVNLISGELVGGHTYVSNILNSIIDVGNVSNEFTVCILDESGVDVTSNYNVTYHYGTLTVTTLGITVSTGSANKYYDGTPLVSGAWSIDQGELAAGHSINVTLNASITTIGSVENLPIITVTDSDGRDVTANYSFTVTSGTLTVEPKGITMVSGDAERDYDGTPLTKHDFTSHNLTDDYTVEAFYLSSITNLGFMENEFYVIIRDADGNDVTANFDITYIFGTLTVHTRPYGIISPSIEKPYDGTPLTGNGEYDVIEGNSLATGHQAVVKFTGSITDVGTTDNSFTVIIYDADGNDVTANYDLSNYVNGVLQVSAVKLNLFSQDDVKMYDGTPLTNSGVYYIETGASVDYQDPIPGYRIIYTMFGSQTNVGRSENIFTITVVDANGKDVTKNFLIEVYYGTLEVTQRPYGVITKDIAKTYDGTPLINDGTYDVAPGGSLATGHVAVVEFTGSQLYKGSSSNRFDLHIYDAEGNDVTYNYDTSSSRTGTLTVSKRSVGIYSQSDSKVYDGVELTKYGVYYDETGVLVDGFEIVPGHRIIYQMSGTQTTVGSSENYFSWYIVNSDNVDVSSNFEVTVKYGKLTVTSAQLGVYSKDATKLYDGTPLTNPGVYYVGSNELVDGTEPIPGHRIVYHMTGERTDFGSARNYFSINIIDSNGADVTDSFDVSITYGELTVKQRTYGIVTPDLSKTYDGVALTNDGTYKETDGSSLATGHVAIIEFVGSQTEAGYSSNKFVLHIYDAEGNDVTYNYDTTSSRRGMLTVDHLVLNLHTQSASKIYDGTELTKHGVYYDDTKISVEDLGPLPGYRIVYVMINSIVDVGMAYNDVSVHVVDSNGNDVTNNFRIEVTYGSLWVTERPYSIITQDLTKTYDGTPLTNDGTYEVAEGCSLVEGDVVVIEFTGSQTVYGKSQNSFVLRVYNAQGKDITGNYNTYNSIIGTLSVTQAELALSSHGDQKVYDGTPLSCYGVYSGVTNELAEYFAPFPGHRIEYEMTGEQTNVGSSNNYYKVTVYNADGKDVTSSFNIKKSYGTLTVYKASLSVYSNGASKPYDGEPLTAPGVYYSGTETLVSDEGPLPGFRITYEMTGVQTLAGITSNTFEIEVYNENGVNVTDNFNISAYFGDLEVTRVSVGLYSDSVSKVYDGTALTGNSVFYIGSNVPVDGTEPIPGHTLIYSVTGKQINAGESANTFSVIIINSVGGDVTDCFDLYMVDGTLTVTPRVLVCGSTDVTKFYDGTALSCQADMCRLLSGNMVGAHTIEFVPLSSAVDVCDIYNEFYAVITDESGTDVTDNYDITYVFGKLTILPRTIKVITPSANHTYDGKEFFCHEYTIDPYDALLPGHTVAYISFSPNATLVNVGIVKNAIAVLRIENGDGVDVTHNYNIDYSDLGDIIVTPRPITIRTTDAAKYYDGTPLRDETWELVSLTQPIEGHLLEVAVSGTRTEVGESQNVIAEVRITDTATGENITANYAITEQLGTLTVKGTNTGTTPPPSGGGGGSLNDSGAIGGKNDVDNNNVCLRVYSASSGSVYLRYKSFGGYDPTAKAWDEAASYGELLDGTYSYNYLTSIALKNTGLDSVRIDIENMMDGQYFLPYFPDTYEANYDVQTSDVIYTGDTSDIYSLYYYLYSDYYTGINADLGEYSDEEIEYRRFVKDNYLYVDENLKEYMQKIISANGFNPNSPTVIYDVATYIQNAAKYNLEYNRSIDYAIHPIIAFLNAKEGICSHYASAATALYRTLGIPARYTIGFVGDTKAGTWVEITGKQAHAWTEVYIDGIGWLPIEVTGSSNDGGSGNGNKPEESKIYTATPRTTYHKYDGNYAYPENLIDGLSALTAKGYYYKATVETVGSAKNLPGIYETKITSFTLYDSSNNDVTSQFKIELGTGHMQIYLREITVRTYGGTKEYDGTPLTSDKYLVEGDLLSGHTIKSLVCTGRQINVGKSTNNFIISIVDTNGVDVTSHYKINRVCASLTVTAKTVTITANSATKPYDGEVLMDDGYTIEGDVSSFAVYVTIYGAQSKIGYSDNIIQKVVIRDSMGADVTMNFSIICINGRLTVTPPKN